MNEGPQTKFAPCRFACAAGFPKTPDFPYHLQASTPTSAPIVGVGVLTGDFESGHAPRDGEIDLVRVRTLEASLGVTVDGGLRGRSGSNCPRKLSRPGFTGTALSRRFARRIRSPAGEVTEGDTTPARSQSQFDSMMRIKKLIVFTREGVPIYLRDVAEVKDTTRTCGHLRA